MFSFELCKKHRIILQLEHISLPMFRPFHAFFSRALCPNAKFNQNLIFHRRELSPRQFSAFFTHDIFHFDARAVKRIRGCVENFIWVVVYQQHREHISQQPEHPESKRSTSFQFCFGINFYYQSPIIVQQGLSICCFQQRPKDGTVSVLP